MSAEQITSSRLEVSELQVKHDVEWIAEWTRSTGWLFAGYGATNSRVISAIDLTRKDLVLDEAYDPCCTIRYLHPTQNGWHKNDHYCNPFQSRFDEISDANLYLSYDKDRAKKIQVGIEVFKPVEYTRGINPLRLAFCRSLEVWQRLSTAELKRGLAATEAGSRSIAGLLGSANSKANEGGLFKSADGKWILNNLAALHRDQHIRPFTPQAIAACKQRAIEMRGAA